MLPGGRLEGVMRACVRRAQSIAGLLVVLALAASVRAVFLDRQGLWTDEFFSLGMATGHSLEHAAAESDPERGDFVESVQSEAPAAYARFLKHDQPPAGLRRVIRAVFLSDTNPPLYYVLLSAWTRVLGTSDTVLRGFTALASLACIPLIWLLARATGGRAAALPAVLLFALSTPCVYYSTEGRMYGLVWLWTVVLLWVVLRAAGQGLGVARALLLVLVGAGGLLTHYFFVFVWAAAIGWLLINHRRAARARVAACALLTLAAVLPWYVRVPATLARWRVSGDWLSWRPAGYSLLAGVLNLPWSYVSFAPLGTGSKRMLLLEAVLIVGLAIAAALKLGRFAFTPRRLLLWSSVSAACVGPVVFDLLRATYTVAVPRYALAGMPAAFALAGLAISRLRAGARFAVIGLVVSLFLASLRDSYDDTSRAGEPYREVGALLAKETSRDDLVLVHSIPSGVCGIARYMEAAQAAATGARFASWVGQLQRRRVPDDLYTLAAGRQRIVFVDIHNVGAEATEREWLDAHASERGNSQHGAAWLSYYGLQDAGGFSPSGSAPHSVGSLAP